MSWLYDTGAPRNKTSIRYRTRDIVANARSGTLLRNTVQSQLSFCRASVFCPNTDHQALTTLDGIPRALAGCELLAKNMAPDG